MDKYHVNITMVTQNRIELTKMSIDSILCNFNKHYVLNIVDNGSDDGTADYLSRLSCLHDSISVHLIKRNMGVSVAANLGWSLNDTPYYIKIDNDMVVEDCNWVDNLLELVECNSSIGMVGYKFCEWHKSSLVTLSNGKLFLDGPCGGGCVLISKAVHEKLGYWNEDYGRYGFEDLEYSNRVRQIGLLTGYTQHDTSIKHLGFENFVDDARESQKQQVISSKASGEKLYLLNKFLFDNKIRPVYVERKYLPFKKNDKYEFAINPDYKSIMRIHKNYLNKFNYEIDGNKVLVDLSNI